MPVDNSRAPAPRKADPKAELVTPTTSVVVLGDAMADWLGYGLEDAFSDSPEIAVVRKNKLHSGLVRYEAKGDLDWWRVARDILTQEKANYVVMMMGVSDRQSIRERDPVKEADKKKGKDQAEKAGRRYRTRRKRNRPTSRSRPPLPSLNLPRRRKPAAPSSFVRDQWAEIYSKRIDETIAATEEQGRARTLGRPAFDPWHQVYRRCSLSERSVSRARAERAGDRLHRHLGRFRR